uniref:Uncharacterized protein n=1 Tax=Rhizophora mucronata TaxID=61149 RepID=A0A2P2P772_RHIMU
MLYDYIVHGIAVFYQLMKNHLMFSHSVFGKAFLCSSSQKVGVFTKYRVQNNVS